MKKYFPLSLIIFVSVIGFFSCQRHPKAVNRPKLIVGIVVDQMRWDYLYRFNAKFGPNGFKRLMREGYSCGNTHINYTPAITGPGHTCVYTGSVPAIHGIVGNTWYNRDRKMRINCVDDSTVTPVGAAPSRVKEVSPRSLLVTTVTDELKIATNNQSKVISLAFKDRSAIYPGGHNPNGAYFLDAAAGNFITTSYYMSALPGWVDSFNNKKLPQKYVSQNWNTLKPIAGYVESTPDEEDFENTLKGESKAVFPHKLQELAEKDLSVFTYTPFANSYVLDFAKAAVAGEQLGQNTNTDFLAISFSSTDYIGHTFGPNSVEVEDCYLRLDKDLGDFFNYLDAQIGKGNYLVFLTADHGVAHAVGYMNQEKMPAGNFLTDSSVTRLNEALGQKFGKGEWVLKFDNMEYYLNYDLLEEKKISRADVFKVCRKVMMENPAVANFVDLDNLSTSNIQPDMKVLFENGYYPKRSGDFEIIYNSGWLEDFSKGATHGTAFNYDTHIPLLWMGWHIKHGQDHDEVHMTDIAPTLSALLDIQEPSGSVGKVIEPVLRR